MAIQLRTLVFILIALSFGLVSCTGKKGGPVTQRTVPIAPTITFVRGGDIVQKVSSGASVVVTDGTGLITVGGTIDPITKKIKVLEDESINVKIDTEKQTFEFDASFANYETRVFTLRALNEKEQYDTANTSITIKLNNSAALLALSTAGTVSSKTATGDTSLNMRGFSSLPMGAQGTLSNQGYTLTPGIPGFVSEASP